MRALLTILSLLISSATPFAQQTEKIVKKIPAVRTMQKIVIDGTLKDSAWLQAPIATDFIEWRPTFGNKEDEKNRTEIRILYDNNAIYIAGYAHEASPDSITKELVLSLIHI